MTWCFLVAQLSQLKRNLEKGSDMGAGEHWEKAQTNVWVNSSIQPPAHRCKLDPSIGLPFNFKETKNYCRILFNRQLLKVNSNNSSIPGESCAQKCLRVNEFWSLPPLEAGPHSTQIPLQMEVTIAFTEVTMSRLSLLQLFSNESLLWHLSMPGSVCYCQGIAVSSRK